jgi:hypothetical protein
MRFLVVLAALMLSVGTAEAACPLNSVEQAGRTVKEARIELKAVRIEEMQEDVPPVARARIEQLKDRLRSFVTAAMACAPKQIDVKALQAELTATGDAFVPGKFHGDGFTMEHFDGDGEGHSLTYQVREIVSHSDMVGVTATLGVECGEDTILLLYQRLGGSWREILVRRSQPYKDVGGSWDAFHYAVSPNDKDSRWFVVTSNRPSWCTSGWTSERFDLSRPGPDAARPDILFHDEQGAHRGEIEEILKADATAFELRYETASISFDKFTRTAVRRYSVVGNTVTRVQPVALNVRDFVDEWIVSPWGEARAWSAPSLIVPHSKLAAIYKSNGSVENDFEGIRSCTGGARQVELIMGKSGPWFFEVANGSSFRLDHVSQEPSSSCLGPVIAIDKP